MFSEHRRQSSLNKIIKEWLSFREIVEQYAGAEDVSQVAEQKFLEQKGRIARGLTELHEMFPASHLREASLNQKAMVDFMAHISTLRKTPQTQELLESFQAGWQRYYLALNQMKGIRGEARKRESKGALAPAHHRGRGQWDRFFDHWFVRVVLVAAVVIGSVWVLANILPWHAMGWDTELATLKDAAGDATGFIQNQAGDVDDRVQGSMRGARGFLQPVIDQWGPETTAIMCTVLLLGFGYFIFIRTR